jgi:hypothetical protein
MGILFNDVAYSSVECLILTSQRSNKMIKSNKEKVSQAIFELDRRNDVYRKAIKSRSKKMSNNWHLKKSHNL